MPHPAQPDYLTVPRAAGMLGVSPRTLGRLLDDKIVGSFARFAGFARFFPGKKKRFSVIASNGIVKMNGPDRCCEHRQPALHTTPTMEVEVMSINRVRPYTETINRIPRPLKRLKDVVYQVPLPPKAVSCVYFLIRGDQIVYIGKTNNLRSRMLAHADHVWDRIIYLPAGVSQLDRLERELIRYVSPEWNSNHTRPDERVHDDPAEVERIVLECLGGGCRLAKSMRCDDGGARADKF